MIFLLGFQLNFHVFSVYFLRGYNYVFGCELMLAYKFKGVNDGNLGLVV